MFECQSALEASAAQPAQPLKKRSSDGRSQQPAAASRQRSVGLRWWSMQRSGKPVNVKALLKASAALPVKPRTPPAPLRWTQPA